MSLDYISFSEVSPGMRVEIQGRPWTGTITSTVRSDGTFRALRDGHDDGVETSWSRDGIGSIRLLRSALTPGGTAVSHYQHARNEGDLPTAAFQSTVSMLVVTYPDAEDLAVAVRALHAYAESRTP